MQEEEEDFGRLVTFWFGTFAMLFGATGQHNYVTVTSTALIVESSNYSVYYSVWVVQRC